MANKAAKGPAFERHLCEQLSLWWSNGARDDCFWRTATSGARATVRSRKGKQTAGHHGDICATDAVGAPFIDLFTVELKRGYNKYTISDLLDKSPTAARQQFEEWLDKADRCHREAGSWSWLLITKRDKREPLLFLPAPVWRGIACDCGGEGKSIAGRRPWLTFTNDDYEVVGMLLSSFLSGVSPAALKALAKKV